MNLISTNVRFKLRNIAHSLHIDSRFVEYHIKRIKRIDIIVTYTADLNLVQLHRELIQIDITLKNPALLNRIISFFDKTNMCLFIHEMLGKYDLSAELFVENDEMLQNILEKFSNNF